MEQAAHKSRAPNATDRAAEWLRGWLATQPDYRADSGNAKAAGREAGHSGSTLKRVLDGDHGVGFTELREGNIRKGTLWYLERSMWPRPDTSDQLPLAQTSEGQ
jgi:hypothetical protein